MINEIKNVVIVSPHPDDETLGAGGTIARFTSLGINVSIIIVSGHLPPLYKIKDFEITFREATEAFNYLGVKNYKFLKIPATSVHTIPTFKLNKEINNFIKTIGPEIVLIPFPDRHIDHRTVFDASIVACRPNYEKFPKIVLSYETLSETHWNVPGIEPSFNPDFFINIDKSLENKIKAISFYKSQINNSPSRSIKAVEALAKFRGSQNGCEYAEAFKVVRIVQ